MTMVSRWFAAPLDRPSSVDTMDLDARRDLIFAAIAGIALIVIYAVLTNH